MQTLRKKTSPLKYFTDRSEPARFFGDGVQFKAKLIGILEVGEARGDRMCQEALQDLKMAIRAAGEHKQRITIHVTIDGLRLRDEKTGDSLYHHPVHKISFIAQDMHDSRAFGYIFGSPDSGHRFFGIKTDKAASQVVLAMRDLFQVVFELKKKEIELARQQIQSKISAHEHQAIAQAVKNSTMDTYSGKNEGASSGASKASPPVKNVKSPESVADLVDLEQELSSIQRGITQMERITPGEAPIKSSMDDDPFGDSFTKFATPFNILPPPPETSRRHPKPTKTIDEPNLNTNTTVSEPTITAPPTTNHSTLGSAATDDWLNSPPHSSITFRDIPKTSDDFGSQNTDDNMMSGMTSPSLANMIASAIPASGATTTKYIDAFTDLDPLGTGKVKPYVDKKYFFHELKNPPKKVLRDLSSTGHESIFDANFSGGQATADLLNEFDVSINSSNTSNEIFVKPTTAGNNSRKDESLTSISSSNDFIDPFTNRDIDPFEEEDFCKIPISDPFEHLHFPPIKSTVSPKTVTVLPDTKITTTNDDVDEAAETGDDYDKTSNDSVYNGPLQVNLPPESWAHYISQKRLERQNSDSQQSIARTRPSVISSISAKKMKPTNIFAQKFTKRDSNSINMRRLQESDSLSENEAAPEPPPRPDTSSQIAPPPLPPKKQFSDIIIRTSARPSSGSSASSRDSNRYDYVSAKLKSQQQQLHQQQDAPPLPLPSRKVGVSGGRYDSTFPGPGRPQKKQVEEDDYLTPISGLRSASDIPTLLPPPQKKDTTKTRGPRKSSETDTRQLNENERQRLTSTQSNEDQQQHQLQPPTMAPPALPDITLSQLLTLGIDELSARLNVPTSKLNTMTIVELTTYLANFIENGSSNSTSSKPVERPLLAAMKNESPTPVFRVSFDDNGPNEATFVAKFDDNFGEDPPFVANFESFNTKPVHAAPIVDRYAVFREIMELDNTDEAAPITADDDVDPDDGEVLPSHSSSDPISLGLDKTVADEMHRLSPNIIDENVAKMKKIDTKITETIANAKDRYAALRDIIMVEDLFDKQNPPLASEESFTEQDDDNDGDDDDYDDATATFNTAKDIEEAGASIVAASPEINVTEIDNDNVTTSLVDTQQFNTHNLSSIFSAVGNKDDCEIDEYMNRAISNLSLDSRVSPIITSKSPSLSQNVSTSPVRRQTPQLTKSPNPQPLDQQLLSVVGQKPSLNDMSTSPIPIQKSPSSSGMQKSPISSSKSPIPPTTPSQSSVNLEPSYKHIGNSAARSPAHSDMICGSSPEYENGKAKSQRNISHALDPNTESWATFDPPPPIPAAGINKKKQHMKSSRDRINKETLDSPCSSDGKDEWKTSGFNKKWPTRGHGSSSSRDVSPWDEEDPEYRRRPRPSVGPPPAPTSGSRYDHPRSIRRLNSGDDDYGYEEEIYDRRGRRIIKEPMVSRSRENFDADGKSWYHSTDHQNWSPAEDERCSFDRSAYERSTYGPPYEKREPKSLTVYDRRGGSTSVGYDRRKYYRGGRSGHDYDYDDPYSEGGGRGHRRSSGGKLRKDYDDDYEGQGHYEMGGRSRDGGSRGDLSRGRDYFYERDKRSFDRESNESYESGGGGGGRRRKSFGSGDVYVDRDRERYPAPPHPESTRSLRRGGSGRNNLRKQHPDDTQDSESDVMTGSGRRSGGSGDMNAPHRSSQQRQQQKMAMEEDEVWGPVPGSGELDPRAATQKPWNRPSSASESERRLTDRNRILMNPLSGSDGEDRRFRKKARATRGGGGAKEVEERRGLHYATMRHGQKYRNPAGDEYYDCEDPVEYASDDEQIGSVPPRGHPEDYEEDPASYYGRQRPQPAYFRGSTSRLEGKSQDMIKGPRYAAVEDVPSGDRKFRKSTSRDFYTDDREPQRKYGDMSPKSAVGKHVRMEFDFDNYAPTATTPQSSGNSNNKKFNFEETGEGGFESDFLNSPPAAPANSAATGSGSGQKAFRFSNDFSDKDSPARQQTATTSNSFGFEADFANNSTKLRFNETVKVAKFESAAATTSNNPTPVAAPSFEDDFSSKTSFDEMEDQWNPEIPKKNNNSSKLRQQSHNKQPDNIKKSESINIFAKKIDPFDDPFFEESKNGNGSDNNNSARGSGGDFGWNRSFANFEDNSEM